VLAHKERNCSLNWGVEISSTTPSGWWEEVWTVGLDERSCEIREYSYYFVDARELWENWFGRG
jgi:hypothetical protein